MVPYGERKECHNPSRDYKELEAQIQGIITNAPLNLLQKTVDSITGRLRKLVEVTAALGYDGASTNTGRKNGSMVCIEKEIGRPLQRMICLLHVNELRHRYLMEHLAGITTGPETRSGHIGEELLHCYDGWINFENETQDRQEWRNTICEREGKDSGFSYDLLDGDRTTFRGMVLRDQPGEYCRRNGRTCYEHGEEHGQHRVPLPLGMKKKERNGRDSEGGGSWGRKTAEEAFLEPIITYEGEKSWTDPAGVWQERCP
ncbi:hypothetical protein ANN_04199 [Periplaneta americana]|uniref:Uncharacterized protein n=1 Tax=Periplaneta americana TaxID=6978 RepID=A0ABQ8T9S8_PERAM|nr:hypothetical protein ANN_04199 [Periplaneta americana]